MEKIFQCNIPHQKCSSISRPKGWDPRPPPHLRHPPPRVTGGQLVPFPLPGTAVWPAQWPASGLPRSRPQYPGPRSVNKPLSTYRPIYCSEMGPKGAGGVKYLYSSDIFLYVLYVCIKTEPTYVQCRELYSHRLYWVNLHSDLDLLTVTLPMKFIKLDKKKCIIVAVQ
jgi:hypothetical protein